MIKLGYTPKKMFEVANDFFTSLGLEPMTEDFWKYSVITRPTGNQQMVCHASAEEFYSETDFRYRLYWFYSKIFLENILSETK